MENPSYLNSVPKTTLQYITLLHKFNENVRITPDKEIQVCRGASGSRSSLTFSDLDKKSDNIAKYLIQKGIRRGQAVCILGTNSLRWIIAQLSIFKAGAVVGTLNPMLKDATDVIDTMRAMKCQGLIVDVGIENELGEYVQAVLQKFLDDNKDAVVVHIRKQTNEEQITNSFDAIFDLNLDDVSLPIVSPEDSASIIPTSGSTGKPKLVVWNHFNAVNQFLVLQSDRTAAASITFNDRPFAWGLGSPMAEIVQGNTRVFTDTLFVSSIKGGSEESIWRIMQEEHCTTASLMPLVIKDLIGVKDTLDLKSFHLRAIVCSGEVMNKSIAPAVGTLCDMLMLLYGSTEMGVMAIQPCFRMKDQPICFEDGKAGKPLPGGEIKIVDDNENVVARGTIGNIRTRAQLRFTGYLGDSELDPCTFKPNGWVSLGDSGFVNNEGNLFIVGRPKYVIKRGTRKVQPEIIENVIESIEGVKSVTVVPVPDERLFEELCACYILENNANISKDDIEKICKEKFSVGSDVDGLGHMPRYFVEFEKLPSLPTSGKVDRFQVRSSAIARIAD